MIHYTCDHCKRTIGDSHQTRYVVKLEAYADLSPDVADLASDDRDHLEEIHDLLETLDSGDLGDEEFVVETCQKQFDLCRECFGRFIRNPLGREAGKALHFSEN